MSDVMLIIRSERVQYIQTIVRLETGLCGYLNTTAVKIGEKARECVDVGVDPVRFEYLPHSTPSIGCLHQDTN